jgi:hypothetical protein
MRHPIQKERSLMTTDHQKVEELRLSAQQLAKQALETAEIGLRLARAQFETVVRPAAAGVAGAAASASAADLSRNLQDVTLNAETKAKEMFTLATNFMAELNDKWQPGTARHGGDAADKPRPEKINIDVE